MLARSMSKRRFLIQVVIIISCCLIFGLCEPTFSRAIRNNSDRRGSTRGVCVGVYSDSRCANALNFINWGQLEPGASESLTCYVRNEGRTAGFLSLSEMDWNPSNASRFVSLHWNYTDGLLYPGQVADIKLTLTLSANVPRGFSFTFSSVIIFAS
jgi:hypothetical protein